MCDSRSVRLELFLGHHVPRHGVICLKIKGTNLNRPSVEKGHGGGEDYDNLVLRRTDSVTRTMYCNSSFIHVSITLHSLCVIVVTDDILTGKTI
jgi:hypothetical protein